MKLFNKLIVFIITSVVLFCTLNIHSGKNNWKNSIGADGKGYYAYLPATFIYHDLNFSFFDSIEKKYPNPNTFYDYRILHNGQTADKYFAGTAIAMLPFFLLANSTANLFGYENDGYSKIYFMAINMAGIFYLFLGLFYLKKLLFLFGSTDIVISFLLILVTFATNLFYYAVCESSMSHIYSFAFITMFIYFLKKYFQTPAPKLLFLLAILLGLIVLIRPVNVLIILCSAFIAGDLKSFKEAVKWKTKHIGLSALGVLIFLLIVFIQLLIYKIQTGNFFIDSYGAEKFNWNDPHPIGFLFSYKKGFFIYTPIAFFSMLGIVELFRKNKFQFYSLLLFLTMLLYVLSSWWNWWYGGSFSSRVCVEYYSILALLLFFAIDQLKAKSARLIYYPVLAACLILCQIQTYQYRYYFIHWEKMDITHYWNVFLRIDLLNKENPNADLLK